MKTGLKGCLILGFVLTGSAAETSPVLTIQVSNQAGVDLLTLVQAEKTATGIFKKTGVESRWIEPATGGSFPLSHIQLKILPSVMSIRSGLRDSFPDNAMGLAPGRGNPCGCGSDPGACDRARDRSPSAERSDPLRRRYHARRLESLGFAECQLWIFVFHAEAGRSDT